MNLFLDAEVNDMEKETLFTPLRIHGMKLDNRIVMAPMTRWMAPGGVLGAANVEYYSKRAKAGVALIITEGTWIPHPAASFFNDAPRFYGEDALAGWKNVIDGVHAAGGRIMPQLWHVGVQRRSGTADAFHPEAAPVGPSGLAFESPDSPGIPRTEPMSQKDIDAVIEAYAQAAHDAKTIGADGIEIHGAHGYLVDQFLWHVSNQRTDAYGGKDIGDRTRFACEIVAECRRRVGPRFPISFRFSQFKQNDHRARLVENPDELDRLLVPLVDAGVDIFHVSTRRYWEPAFEGRGRSLAGWTKLITDCCTIAVGSVGLASAVEIPGHREGRMHTPTGVEPAIAMLANGECDLIAVGRGLIANPDWVEKVRAGNIEGMRPYSHQLAEFLDLNEARNEPSIAVS